MAREYFCAYHSMAGAMRNISDAECGRLFKALLAYSSGEEKIKLQGREEVLFDVFSQQIDRDNERYRQKCEQNRRNIKERYTNATNVDERIQPSTKTYEIYQDKGKGEIPPISPKGEADEGFAAFWAEYPRHVAKATAVRSWQKINPDASLQESIMDGLRRQKDSVQWQRDGGKYIPHPSTWLNQRRWEDEVECAVQQEMPAQQIRWID